MTTNFSYKFIASLLVIGVILFSGGLYASQVRGYSDEDSIPETGDRLTLGQWVYYQEPDGPKQYIGDLLGVYTIGTKMCMLYEVTGNYPDIKLSCYTGANIPGHEDGYLRENGWGLLVNAFPDISEYNSNQLIPSTIYGIIPVMTNDQLSSYVIGEITGSAPDLGHTWT
ncbi:hypothetical protein ACFL0Z_01765, partial [Patescibacteria group bacterium]